MAETENDVQYFVRLNSEDKQAYLDRCKAQNRNHAEITRILMQEYASGRLVLTVSKPIPLEDALA